MANTNIKHVLYKKKHTLNMSKHEDTNKKYFFICCKAEYIE